MSALKSTFNVKTLRDLLFHHWPNKTPTPIRRKRPVSC